MYSRRKTKQKHIFSRVQVITLSFLVAILIGTGLLMLPVMSVTGKATPFVDAMFTATTSVCVTGLVTVTTASHWSALGHLVILLLIQLGGLGTITLMSLAFFATGRRISLQNRLLMADAFNLDNNQGIVRFVIHVIRDSLIVEAIGALAYACYFVPHFGLGRGSWYAIFHSISAFCNAGIDLLAPNSLINYAGNWWLNFVTMFLIICGGLGFTVWNELGHGLVNQYRYRKKGRGKRLKTTLSQHSKVVLLTTAILILGGAVLYYLFERNNPATLGKVGTAQAMLEALFQSVTTRTAGFVTISQADLTIPSVMLTVFLMFIGGSPTGTAGGVKTTTLAVIMLEVKAIIKGEEDVICFRRRIGRQTIRKAIAITVISVIVSVMAVLLMYFIQPGDMTDNIFEVYSALGTVGISRDLTPDLTTAAKYLIIACMYLGRVGPASILLALTKQEHQADIKYAAGNIRVG